MEALFGDSLVKHDGSSVPTGEALAGADYVLIYFSAHWCPPCRGFTPRLAAYYTEKSSAFNFKAVFASGDHDAGEMASYFKEMPWGLAVPYSARKTLSDLNRRFGVEGIPSLIVVDKTGALVTKDGREGVIDAPEAFPWRPKPFWETFGESSLVTAADGAPVPTAALRAKKHLFLYFSAHWCGPCRQFTPMLASWYTSAQARAKAAGGEADFEVVFVSSDRSQADFDSYRAEMPWPALAYAERGVKNALSKKFAVSGIPTLLMLDAGSGEVLIGDARTRVGNAPEGYPWAPKPVEVLDDAIGEINDLPHVLAFSDKLTDAAAEVALAEAMEAAAKEFAGPDGKPSASLRFALAREADEATDNVRSFIGLGRDKDGAASLRVVLLDIPEGRKAVMPASATGGGGSGVPSGEAVAAFVRSYLGGGAATAGIKEAVQPI